MSGTPPVAISGCPDCAPENPLHLGHTGDHTRPSAVGVAIAFRIGEARKCAASGCSVLVPPEPGELHMYCDHHRIAILERRTDRLSHLLSEGRIRVAFTVDEEGGGA